MPANETRLLSEAWFLGWKPLVFIAPVALPQAGCFPQLATSFFFFRF
jgi:hypothetical protein